MGSRRAHSLLGSAAFAIGLGACRTPLPPATPHTRVEPQLDHLPSIRACWLESAQALGNTVGSLVVRHPSGTVVVDAGNSMHFADEIRAYPLGAWFWYRLVPGLLLPSRPLAATLRDNGVDPSHTLMILTHVHFDHAGGLMDMPDVPVMVGREEIALVDDARHVRRFEVLPTHAERLAPLLQPVPFDHAEYETFDERHDLFGDGSIVIVPLRGHTPGSIGVFVNVSREQRLFLVGDAVHDSAGYLDRVDKPWLTAVTDSDPEAARDVVARIHQFHEIAPRVEVLPAHARDAWMHVFGAPGRCVGTSS